GASDGGRVRVDVRIAHSFRFFHSRLRSGRIVSSRGAGPHSRGPVCGFVRVSLVAREDSLRPPNPTLGEVTAPAPGDCLTEQAISVSGILVRKMGVVILKTRALTRCPVHYHMDVSNRLRTISTKVRSLATMRTFRGITWAASTLEGRMSLLRFRFCRFA